MSKPDLISASADTDATAADEADRLAEAVERAALRLRMVQEIAAVGMTLLRGLGERVAAAQAAPAGDKSQGAAPADAADDFAKISRGLRLTLDLEARFDETLRALQAGKDVALKARARRAAEASEKQRQARKEKVISQVSIAITRECESEAADEERYDAMEERLDEDKAYADLTNRPLREVVGQLCADIGLTVDWTGWGEDGWPEPPRSGPEARDRWSPFRVISPRAIGVEPP